VVESEAAKLGLEASKLEGIRQESAKMLGEAAGSFWKSESM
jgi:hypothetical protein